MQSLTVRHESLPGVGDLYELRLASGATVQVAELLSGRRHLSIGVPGATEPGAIADLTRDEATGLATLLLGAQVEIIKQEG